MFFFPPGKTDDLKSFCQLLTGIQQGHFLLLILMGFKCREWDLIRGEFAGKAPHCCDGGAEADLIFSKGVILSPELCRADEKSAFSLLFPPVGLPGTH